MNLILLFMPCITFEILFVPSLCLVDFLPFIPPICLFFLSLPPFCTLVYIVYKPLALLIYMPDCHSRSKRVYTDASYRCYIHVCAMYVNDLIPVTIQTFLKTVSAYTWPLKWYVIMFFNSPELEAGESESDWIFLPPIYFQDACFLRHHRGIHSRDAWHRRVFAGKDSVLAVA